MNKKNLPDSFYLSFPSHEKFATCLGTGQKDIKSGSNPEINRGKELVKGQVFAL